MTTDTRTRTVLFVDDNPDDCDLLQIFAEKDLHSVKIVCCGTIAEGQKYLTAALETGTVACVLPSLVLVDFVVGSRTGRELIAWVRSQPSLSRLPLILFTDGESGNRFEACYEAGANCCLVKPGRLEEIQSLLQCVKRSISGATFLLEELQQRAEYRPRGWKPEPA